MKTHLKDVIHAFLNENRICKEYLLLFLLFSFSSICAQINLNGFAQVSKLQYIQNSKSIFATIIDPDSEPDYVVATTSKKLVFYLSSVDYNPIEIKLPYNVSILKRVNKISKTESKFAFISRSEKLFGTFIVNNLGKTYNFETRKFDSSPQNFSLSKNGKKAILFGNNFNGLVLIDLDLSKNEMLLLLEKKIINDAVFYDFDNDFNTDIIYSDIFSSSINLIKNEVNFQLTEVNLNRYISDLVMFRKADYNYDGFEDLLIASQQGIQFFAGDSVSTIGNGEYLIRESGITNFQLGDFNRDGYFDIVYSKLDSDKKSKLYIVFSNSTKISKPYLISGIRSVTSFDISGWAKDKIAYLTEGGELLIHSPFGELENTKLMLGQNPKKIFSFKPRENLLLNMIVLDSVETKLNYYATALGNYYEIPLKDYHDEIRIIDLGSEEVFFAIFSKGKKLIELSKLNLKDGTTWLKQFYTTNKIVDIQIKEDKEFPFISVLTQTDTSSTVEQFSYKDFRYQKSDGRKVLDNTLGAVFSSRNSIIYLTIDSTGIIGYGEKYLKLDDTKKSNHVVLLKTESSPLKAECKQFNIREKIFSIVSLKWTEEMRSYLITDGKRIQVENYIPLNDLSVANITINNVVEVIYRLNDDVILAEINMRNGKFRTIKKVADYNGDFVIEYVNQKNGYIFMINEDENLIELKKIE